MTFIHSPTTKKVREGACVLYEPGSGQIRHMHHIVVLEGGHNPSEAQAEAAARAALERRGRTHSHLAVLHAAQTVEGTRFYRVDVKSKKLVEEAVKARKR
jgi:hypothetical protein